MSDFDLFGDSLPPESESEPSDLGREPKSPAQANLGLDGADDDDLTPPSSEANESYTVVARRYRPQTFAQLIGQEHVQSALCGAIANGQIGHAYLFSGPRGTGKTSTARIFAKALNCQDHGPRPDPCGKCESCRAITNANSLDVIEIDAASNTGVDNIRDLRNGVALAPFSRYKVYIIDEVHMLSTQAFNALLKTLEEPPSNVVFILATTDPQKVPETIVSRCQCFNFRRFSINELEQHLGMILDKELERRHTKVDTADREKILQMIAQNAEGGMRDAQVALDQVLVLTGDKLDYETVRRFLGAVDFDMLDKFLIAMKERNAEALLGLINDLVASGQDLELFVKTLTIFIRNLLIARTAPNHPELLNMAQDRHAQLVALALSMPISFLLNSSSALLALPEKMKQASQIRFLVEVTLLRLITVDAVEDIDVLLNRIQALENAICQHGLVAGPSTPPTQGTPPSSAAPAANGSPSPTPTPSSGRNAKPAQEVVPQQSQPVMQESEQPDSEQMAQKERAIQVRHEAQMRKMAMEQMERDKRKQLQDNRGNTSEENVLKYDELQKHLEGNPELKQLYEFMKTRYNLSDDNFSYKFN
ncbi:MAG: DNA polymerase III subunit gamma/tau [Candidatus Sumerlaeales bacterium]|nr:DNA polymerase III subunit gamma/tau [Candidatus Sumerlaeales bacterium]